MDPAASNSLPLREPSRCSHRAVCSRFHGPISSYHMVARVNKRLDAVASAHEAHSPEPDTHRIGIELETNEGDVLSIFIFTQGTKRRAVQRFLWSDSGTLRSRATILPVERRRTHRPPPALASRRSVSHHRSILPTI
jgi:hypothetical protein